MPYKNKIEKSIEKYIFRDKNSRLQEAMAYSALGGGKRVRAQLYLRHLESFKGLEEADYDYSGLLEMVHSYSLVHDDLPAMDDDVLRRGKATNHLVYGEALAILAGDGLLNLAYEGVMSLAEENPIFLKLGRALAQAAGDSGMIYGQMLDLSFEGRKMEKEQVLEMLSNKTGKLIAHPIEAAALRAGFLGKKVEAWKEIGMKLGLAFQIKDDLLDRDSTPEVLGKTVGKDKRSEKNSYVELVGYDRALKDYHHLEEEILRELKALGGDDKLYSYYQELLERNY